MTNAIPKLLTAAAAAAMLSISPVMAQTAAQQQGMTSPEVVPHQDLDRRVNPDKRTTMTETFRGLTMPPATDVAVDATIGATVPETFVTHPVPPEIVAAVPETQGYEYFALPDGRIVFVHPETNTIAMILD